MDTTTKHRHYGRRLKAPTPEQLQVLATLDELREERAGISRRDQYTARGRIHLDAVYERMRAAIERGRELDIRPIDMANVLGVNRNAFHKIWRGKTGPGS